ncbi:hypothetical protein [Paraburkholderia terricola]|uniref:hypothetical protein n=1 Tax=Paraburkholderia terricola TaxID=169427 RepID=UPI0028567451|nr:hypothetical protein [Paraburkholderia terricola]MDR6482004.1 hypothetical protein [Paraburkholderia terricola]
MQRNRKFDSVTRFLHPLVVWMVVASNAARAESLHGKFANGQAYSGEYAIAESSNADGMRVNPVTIKLKVDGEKSLLQYAYVTDDLPSVKASDMGFLSIVVNSGGMEGSVTYNYVTLNHGALVSIGIVQTTLHLGKIERIDVQPNKNLTKDENNEFVRQIVRFDPPALSKPLNAYSAATLLLLSQGRFLTLEDDFRLSALYGNKEISADPVLLHAIKSIAFPVQSKDDVLLGRFPNVLLSNGAMSSIVEKSTTGTPLIRIVTDGSRNKYDIVVPIIEVDGKPYTDCVYKSVFDSNDGSRSVGVSCSLKPLRQFDPEAAVNEGHLLKYRKGFHWLRDAVARDCATPLGIEYGSYHIALCADQPYPDPSHETTIVYGENGRRIFSVRGYEIILGGLSEGEFAFVGASGERTTFYTNNLNCADLPEISEKTASKHGTIGKYRIRYSARKAGDCAYGTYSYENKAAKMNLFGTVSKDFVHLLEMTDNKVVTGLFNLNPNVDSFSGNWISVPPGNLLPVK